MFSMKSLYFEFGLVFLLVLRDGLTLTGVDGSFGASCSELPALPLVTPGPPSASLDAAKSPEGVGLPVAGGACSVVAASPAV